MMQEIEVLYSQEDKFYFGSGVVNTLEVERKAFDRFDYADKEFFVLLPALSMYDNIIKPSGAAQIEAGDVLYQVQGLTKAQFNQIISMLQTDPSFVNNNNFGDYVVNSGDNIAARLSTTNI